MPEPNEYDPPRRPWDDRDDDDSPRRGEPDGRPQPSNGLATAGLVLGILSLCTAR